MSLDQLISSLHSNLTGSVPAPVQVTAEPTTAPEDADDGTLHRGDGEAPHTLAEVAVNAITENDPAEVVRRHLGDKPAAVTGVLSEAYELGYLTAATLTATLTPAGIALASERGWLNNEENEMSNAIDWTAGMSASAKDARAFVAANVEDYPHVEAARKAEQDGKGRKTVLAAIDKAEKEMLDEDERLDAEAEAAEEAVNEAIAEAATAAFAEIKPAPAVTRTLAEAKEYARRCKEALAGDTPEDASAALDDFYRLIGMVLAVPDGPAPRKAKAKAAPRAPIKRVENGTIVRTYKGSEMVVRPALDGKWDYVANPGRLGVSLAAVLKEHGITGYSGPEFFGYPTVTWVDGQAKIVLGK